MRAGKHVLCEKPMATSILDAVEMLRVAHATGRILGVGFHLRHNLVVEEVEQKVRAGIIGNVKYATAQFNLTSSPPPRLQIPHAIWKRDPEQMGGAGALMGMGVHLIDLLRFVVGSEVCAVQAAAVGMTQESPLESFGQVLLEFDSGAQAHLAYGGSFPLSRNDAVVYGERGRVIAKDVIDVATGGKLELLLIDDATGAGTEANQPAAVDHYQRQFEAFNNALLRGTPFRADGVDGLQAVQVACAIIQAQRSGQRVWVGENLAIDLNRNAPE
jgi:1,5-anhydro-D-fructose reductase (1,5-anhydro-D-mannitol-forming)